MTTAAGKDAAQRKRDERARYRQAGRVLVQYWVRPQDKLAMDTFAQQLLQCPPVTATPAKQG